MAILFTSDSDYVSEGSIVEITSTRITPTLSTIYPPLVILLSCNALLREY
jgi:hypothetical protein